MKHDVSPPVAIGIAVFTALWMLAMSTVPAVAEAITKPMTWTPDSGMQPGAVEGTSAVLEKGPFGAAMAVKSSGLTPGDVVTVWWVVIQNPDVCAGAVCTPVETMGDGERSDSVVTLAASGLVADDGTISLAGYLPKGEVEGNFFDTTFHSPETAEYHLPIHNHGPLEPEIAQEMLSSFRAGCTDDSIPDYYPQTALADGVEGTFECKTVQVVAFPEDE